MGTQVDPALLHEILSNPTAPFREGHILRVATRELQKAAVPYFTDPVGNLVIGVDSKAQYLKVLNQKSDNPLPIFMAHMDHPGFHGASWQASSSPEKLDELEFRWFGGSPTQHLVGAKVALATREGWVTEGEICDAQLDASGRSLISGRIKIAPEFELGLTSSRSAIPATSLFGGFRFRAPVWQVGDLIYTHAADDLVGVFAILSLAIETWTHSWKNFKRTKQSKAHISPPWVGLLTRAEEVGFIGAIGHFQLGWSNPARRRSQYISLETSRALPGAEIGKGPIVRLGDRFTVFDPVPLHVLTSLAQEALPGRHQRRIMDGGTCEASVAAVFGCSSLGISIPLGNYHNQSIEGGPDSAPSQGPAPEFVHWQDVQGMLELCRSLIYPKVQWSNPWKQKKQEFKKGMLTYRALIRQKP